MSAAPTILAAALAGQLAAGDSTGSFREAILGIVPVLGARAELDVGEPVVRVTADPDSSSLHVVGAVRVDAPFATVWNLARDARRFRGPRAGVSLGVFGVPPTLSDVDDVPLDREDLRDLLRCKEGACEWKLRSDFIRRFRREVDWQASGAEGRAAALVREMLVTTVREFLEGGTKAVGSAADRSPPREWDRDHRRATARISGLAWLEPDFRVRLLEGKGLEPGEAVFWSVEKVRKPVVALTHVFARRVGSLEVGAVGYRQFWANHYFRAAVELVWVLRLDEGTCYLVLERATLVDPPSGIASGLVWSRIVSRARSRATELLRIVRSAPEG